MAMTWSGGGRGFCALLLVQFLNTVADAALLIAAISLLDARHAPGWTAPALRISYYFTYVLLGPFAGAVSDSFQKGKVILASSLSKLVGCGLLLAGLHPLLAFALAGLGGAAYAPARYGIMPELLQASALVRGNAWIEASTVVAMLIGVGVGSLLIDPRFLIASIATPTISAIAGILAIYAVASLSALSIPRTGIKAPAQLTQSAHMLSAFFSSAHALWRDPVAACSLVVTCAFWAVAAALQFIILRWATVVLALPLSEAALLQGAVAVGIALGAMLAARLVPMVRALRVVPLGLVIGVLVLAIPFISNVWATAALLSCIGLLSGLLLVPMNAVLQWRGNRQGLPGRAVAVQNFCENLASLAVLAVYGGLVFAGVSVHTILGGLGVIICCATTVLLRERIRRWAR